MDILSEKRVIRDPIHGYIHIDNRVIWDLLSTKEVQRLRRVRQLGSTLMVFPSGEHSRFTHSLGAYEIARRMVNEVDDLANSLTEREKMVVMIAALLHDVGHAPFSHSFETIMKHNHEEYTIQIIKGPSEVAQVLRAVDDDLPDEVASVIEHTHPNAILCQLISSQLDCDRLDYLLRDSYFTGVSYGQIDLDRILRTMRVSNGKVVVKSSSIYTVENYIMARYHMYLQVYYHPNSRSFDTLLREVFVRLKDLWQQDPDIVRDFPMYEDLLENDMLTNEQFYQLDDSTCIYSFHLMENYHDPILQDLARRILERDLLEHVSVNKADELKKKAEEKGFDANYYVVTDLHSQIPYQPYKVDDSEKIWVINEEGKILELSQISDTVKALSSLTNEDERVFYPREILDD